jgi:hypothetical protein
MSDPAETPVPLSRPNERIAPKGPAAIPPDPIPLPREYQAALQMVQQYNPTCSGFFFSSLRKRFFDGDLITIGFREPSGRDVLNFVLKVGDDLEIYRNESLLLDGLAGRSAARKGILGLLQSDNVTGLIAIIIILSIVGLVMAHPSDPKVPDVLSSGLALILGFYFGRKSS